MFRIGNGMGLGAPLCLAAGAALAVYLAAGVALAAPPQLAGFPKRELSKNQTRGITVDDIDGNGQPDILVMSEEELVVLGADGRIRPGFSVSVKPQTQRTRLNIPHAPLACDITRNGAKEIILASASKQVFAIDAQGALVSGYPVTIDGVPKGALACTPKGEVVLTTDNGSLQRISGTGKSARARTIGDIEDGAESGVAVADIDGDGLLDYISVGGDARVYAFNERGKELPSIDLKMKFRSSGIPAIGDVNDDGKPDIVVASQDFSIYAIGLDGKVLPGFPHKTKYRIYASVALGDLDGNGVLDIVSVSGDGQLFALDGYGKTLKGFPLKLDGRVESDPIIADVDRDGSQEIAVTTQSGSLYLVQSNGKNYSGFPQQLGGKIKTAPAFADLNGDGLPELIAQSGVGTLNVYTFKDSKKAKQSLVAWAMTGHDGQHSGRFGPNPGRFRDLGYAKKEHWTTDPLTAQYVFFDLDGDKEAGTKVRWYRDGKHVSEHDDKKTLEAAATKKHERWRYTLQDGENFKLYGFDDRLTRVFQGPEVKILNTEPTVPKIRLDPKPAYTTQSLTVKIDTPSQDPDGDKIVYRYIWLKDGKVQKRIPTSSSSADAKLTRKGETWKVVVVAFDGEVEGQPTQDRLVVRNTKPGAAVIALGTPAPKVDDVVPIQIKTAAQDPDNDKLRYAYRYWVDGKPLGLPEDVNTIPARVLRKHQKVKVEVTTWDDETAGGATTLEFDVKNTPPAKPTLAIWPNQPKTTDTLMMGVQSHALDRDGDGITYRHQWFLNGGPVAKDQSIASADTQKGQKWRLEVTPYDGEAEGPKVVSETVIGNTPPTPPLMTLLSTTPTTDATIRPTIVVPASDADADETTLRYRWSLNGKRVSFPESKTELLPTDTKKHQNWRLEVYAHDGQEEGTPNTLDLRIKNTPPTAPGIALSHTQATIRDTVKVSITKAAADIDGDKMSYRYRWYLRGVRQKEIPESQSELKPGQGKKGDLWRVEVVPYDGEEEGALASAKFRILNHAPDAPKVALSPERPNTTQALACKVVASMDADDDRLGFETRWYRDGQPLSVSPSLATLPSAFTREKQRFVCEVRSHDGELVSPWIKSAEVSIVNAAPTAPKIQLMPASATTQQDLRCQIDAVATDADFDAITYKFVWTRDGKPVKVSSDTQRIPASQTRSGQTWNCSVTPNDGEENGPTGSASTQIINTPPGPPLIGIAPERPRAGEPIRCDILEFAKDADGDRLRYLYSWYKDGRQQSFAAASTEVPGRLVDENDIWYCEVRANDGKADGKAARSADVIIGKAKPKANVEPEKKKRRRRYRR